MGFSFVEIRIEFYTINRSCQGFLVRFLKNILYEKGTEGWDEEASTEGIGMK